MNDHPFLASAHTPKWVTLVFVLTLAQSVLLLVVEARRRGERLFLQRMLNVPSTLTPYDTKADPVLGTRAPSVLLRDSVGRQVCLGRPRGARCAVLFIAACNDCVVDLVNVWERLVRSGHHALVVTASSPREAQAFRVKHRLTVPFLIARPTTGTTFFNAVWRPRAYVIDPGGVLRYVQQPSESKRDMIESIGRLVTHRESDFRRASWEGER